MIGHRKNNWRRVQLGALVEFRNGVNFSKENFGTGIKVIGVSDFQSNVRATFDQLDEINPEGVVRKEHLLRNGDILFVRSNGNRDLIGRSMYVDSVPGEVTHSAFSIRLRFTSPECNPRFYAYLFRSQLIRQALSLYGGGTNISNLNQDILGLLQVPVPPLATQEQIAQILSAYDDLIDNNTRRIKVLEEMAQMLYREWFVDFRFPGHGKVRMVESKSGRLPDGWSAYTLGEVATVNKRSIKDDSPEEISYIDIASVSTGSVDSVAKLPFSKAPGRARRVVREGDTIWSTVRPNRKSFALILRPEAHLIASTGFAVLSPRTIPYSYLYFATTTDEFTKYLTNHATGSAYPAVNSKDFEAAKILVPPKALLDEFHNTVEPMLHLRHVLRMRNVCLRTTRDLLLPKLMSGEVSVEKIESESATQTV